MEPFTQLVGEHHPWRPAPDVVARRLEESGVLVNLATNRVFELNDTGMRIWELLVEGVQPPALPDRLAQEFDVTAGQAQVEVRQAVEVLRAEGLLVP